MLMVLLLALFTLPILEVIVFIRVADQIGWLSVIGFTLLTAVIGTLMIRAQGLRALATAQEAMAAGKAPVAAVVDGVFLTVAAPLLMTPGFVTDAMGFLLLVPALRHALARVVLRRLEKRLTVVRMDRYDGPMR